VLLYRLQPTGTAWQSIICGTWSEAEWDGRYQCIGYLTTFFSCWFPLDKPYSLDAESTPLQARAAPAGSLGLR